MARRKHYRKKSFKLKLRNETVYTVFAIGLILLSLLFFLSFLRSGSNFILLNDLIGTRFGHLSILLPFVLLFFGFLFLRLKIFLSQPNVSLGFLLFFLSLLGVTKSGSLGLELFSFMSGFLTDIGARIVFLGGIAVGIIVFFDTSLDEILGMASTIWDNLYRFFPKKIFSLFKTKKPMIVNNKSIAIKAGKDIASFPPVQSAPVSQRKELTTESNLSEKLISNALSGVGIWEYPSISLLDDSPGKKADRGDVKRVATIIEKTLDSFGIEARVGEVNLGPAVTQYALELALGTKVSKITSLANDLALATEAPTGQIRIEAPIPGRNLVGIEIPNRSLEVVTLKTMLSSSVMRKNKSKLTFALGLDVSGSPVVADIAKMPHVLIAGTTGSGKSVMINSVISSLLFRASPSEVKLILIDPKRVELTTYNGIPHLLTPVIVEADQILSSLKWAMKQMDERYKIFAEAGVRNIDSYNELSGFQALPYIVIMIDELADLMAFAPVEVEDAIARLAQMARATGIHLVLSTQRPSVNVITGLIKANIPCRIAFNVSSMIDSRVIIDMPGAEKLLGRGDMLYIPPEQAKPTRIQGTFVSDREVKKVVEYLRTKTPHVEFTKEVISQQISVKRGGVVAGMDGKDSLFEEAVRVVCQHDRASSSLLQRRLSIGYARAARILDQLEISGIVGPGEGSKPRDVLIKNPDQILETAQEIH